MKKFFSTILLLSAVLMFSSCIIYTNDDDTHYTPPTYDFYFNNNSNYDVRDFYLEDRNGNKHSKINDGFACSVSKHEIQSITGLQRGEYRLYYEYYDSLENLHKYYTNYIDLNSDTTYKLKEDDFISGTPRSAQ